MISADNPDPEGQGFCQAGFSVDFTKVSDIFLSTLYQLIYKLKNYKNVSYILISKQEHKILNMSFSD